MIETVTVGQTSKGARVWLQGVYSKAGVVAGTRYDVSYSSGAIVVSFHTNGKRRVTDSKGGIIDLVSKRVTQALDGAQSVRVDYAGSASIIIMGESA